MSPMAAKREAASAGAALPLRPAHPAAGFPNILVGPAGWVYPD